MCIRHADGFVKISQHDRSKAGKDPGTFFKLSARVRDTLCKIGLPTAEQVKAYIAMLSSMASLKGDLAAGAIDF